MRKNFIGKFLIMLFLLLLCVQFAACGSMISLKQMSTDRTATAVLQANAQERQIAQTIFNAINKDRASAGLPPLQWDDALASSARQHNRTMMTSNQLSHQLNGEPGLGDREKQQGIQWAQAAENIGFTEVTNGQGALDLHKAMMAEQPPDDGHRQNILNTQSNKLGIDVLLDAEHGKLWLTEDFARVQ